MHRSTVSFLAGAAALALSASGVAAQQDDSLRKLSVTRSFVDYTPLIQSPYDYSDIMYAKAVGFSDSDVATLYVVARESGVPFARLVQRSESGESLSELRSTYGIPVIDLKRTDLEKDKIFNYMIAVEASGARPTTASPASESGINIDRISSVETLAGRRKISTNIVSDGVSDIISESRGLATFSRLIDKAGLSDILNELKTATVFAPTDDAFAKMPFRLRRSIENNPDRLKDLIFYHIIPSRLNTYEISQMVSPESPPTLDGGRLTLSVSNGTILVNGSPVTRADVQAANGYVHEIDQVLLPSGH